MLAALDSLADSLGIKADAVVLDDQSQRIRFDTQRDANQCRLRMPQRVADGFLDDAEHGRVESSRRARDLRGCVELDAQA